MKFSGYWGKECSGSKRRSGKQSEDEGVSKSPALRVGDILTDLAEQRQYENNHASGTELQSDLF